MPATNTLVPSTAPGHIDLIRSVMPQYWKDVGDLTARNFLTFNVLQQYGSITFNHKSHTQVWAARVRQPLVSTATENSPIEFQNWDTLIQFQIGNRGYRATDFMPEIQELVSNGSPHAITNRYNEKSADLAQAMVERLSRAFYLNGNAAANAADMAGILTALSYDAGTVTAADKIALPTGSYCGQNLALGSLGGSWSADLPTKPNASLARDFPFGQGTSEYDATSPLIVNYGSTAWGTGGTTWATNAVEAVSFAQTAMIHRGGQSLNGAPPMVVMSSEMMPDLKANFRDKNRQIMPYTNGDLGFPGNTMTVDGAVYSTDYAVPAGNAFMYLPQYMHAFFLHNQMYSPRGPEFSMEKNGFLYYVASYGNFKFQPKFLCRFIRV